MRKYSAVAVVLLLLFTVAQADLVSKILKPFLLGGVENPASNGNNCAACTVIVGILESISAAQQIPIEKLMADVCTWLPEVLREPCGALVKKFVLTHQTPDVICLKLKMCTNPTCHLFPLPPREQQQPQQHVDSGRQLLSEEMSDTGEAGITPWEWLKELIERLANDHLPIVDLDQDRFSTVPTLRGSNWRGRDCNDMDKNIYPGRIETNPSNPNIDQNCNGIYGKAPDGQAYEDTLCNSVPHLGVMILGDSAAAHFHVDPSYVNGSEIHKGTYSDLLYALQDEFDWPHMSSTTGFAASTPDMPVDSIYMRMRERNRCIHRDYQNIAVNGARVGAMANNIIGSLARNNRTDHPMLVFFALIGNDVCNPHPSLDHMTKPQDFYNSVEKSLAYLDTVLPAGSHVVFMGLVDGRVLWDNMSNRTHPVGVKYSALYNWLNWCVCIFPDGRTDMISLEMSPCWAWLNENATVRDAGSARAAELSAQYKLIMANHQYKNFDMAYYDFPLKEVIEIWTASGGETWQLIEPVDGFHPNQISNALSAQIMWNHLLEDHPSFLGEVNPNNDLIQQLFGDQGGH